MGTELVGSVLSPRNPCFLQMRENPILAQAEKGPDVNPSTRETLDGARRQEAVEPTASCQTHEHAFRNIVLLMTEPQGTSPFRTHHSIEKFKAGFPCVGFTCRWVSAVLPTSRTKGHPQRTTDLPAKHGISIRRQPAQCVIEMKRHQILAMSRPMRPDQKEQGE